MYLQKACITQAASIKSKLLLPIQSLYWYTHLLHHPLLFPHLQCKHLRIPVHNTGFQFALCQCVMYRGSCSLGFFTVYLHICLLTVSALYVLPTRVSPCSAIFLRLNRERIVQSGFYRLQKTQHKRSRDNLVKFCITKIFLIVMRFNIC